MITSADFTAPALRVRLTSGAEMEVGEGSLEVIRAVVGELAHAEGAFAAGEESSC